MKRMRILTMRHFPLWHFVEWGQLTVLKYFFVMGSDALLVLSYVWQRDVQCRAVCLYFFMKIDMIVCKIIRNSKFTCNSASFKEWVEIPPVLLRLERLWTRSAILKDSCSSLSRLDKLTLMKMKWKMENCFDLPRMKVGLLTFYVNYY